MRTFLVLSTTNEKEIINCNNIEEVIQLTKFNKINISKIEEV